MKKGYVLLCSIAVIISVFFLSVQGRAQNPKFSMTYLFFSSSSTYLRNIDRTNGAMDVVSPNYFDISPQGNLVIKNIDTVFLKQMKDRNIKVVPFLSNHWDRKTGENALTNRDKLSTQIADAVRIYNLDGVNIDIEGLMHDKRNEFTDFVRLVRSKIPASKEVSVAVAANPNGWNVGWHGMYDYNQLSRHSDYLMIMAYDESWEGSKPGPVASLSFTENSIRYALNQKVPKEKIVLGLPFYGRIWNLNHINNNSIPKDSQIIGRGVSLHRLQYIISVYNPKIEYFENMSAVKATFTVNNQSPKANLYTWGLPLSNGTYEIWYENADTLRSKIELIHKYDIKGAGSWSLGQETSDIWDNYNNWLKGRYFKDVSSGHWAESYIYSARDNGWMIGAPGNLFMPENSLSRAQAAATLVRALNLEAKTAYGNYSVFNDVSNFHWARNEIDIINQYGLMIGKGPGVFAPDAGMTREQMAMLLYRLLADGRKANEEFKFPDMNKSSWSYEAVLVMHEYGLFKGYEDGSFRPYETITRAQMAVIMKRLESVIPGQ